MHTFDKTTNPCLLFLAFCGRHQRKEGRRLLLFLFGHQPPQATTFLLQVLPPGWFVHGVNFLLARIRCNPRVTIPV